MNVALIIFDDPAETSFYHQDGVNYKLSDNTVYTRPSGIRSIFNTIMPFNGTFVKASEGFPDMPFDVIFAVMDFVYDPKFVDVLRLKYPNAIILGYTKERSPLYYTPKHRLDFFNQCDAVACPYSDGIQHYLQNIVKVQVLPFYYPYDVGGLRKKYLVHEKRDIIMVGCNPKRGYEQSELFAKEMAKRYELMVIEKPDFPWHDWLTLLSSCKICINLETHPEIGQVPIECAILGIEHIGGIADAAKELFPWSATNDVGALRPIVDGILSQKISYADMALGNVLNRHSYATAIANIANIFIKLNKKL